MKDAAATTAGAYRTFLVALLGGGLQVDGQTVAEVGEFSKLETQYRGSSINLDEAVESAKTLYKTGEGREGIDEGAWLYTIAIPAAEAKLLSSS